MDHSLLEYLKTRVDWSRKAHVGVTLTREKGMEILDALLNECHEGTWTNRPRRSWRIFDRDGSRRRLASLK